MKTGTYAAIGDKLTIYFERSTDSDALKVHGLIVDKETTEIPKLYVRHAEMKAILLDGGRIKETVKEGVTSASYLLTTKDGKANFLHWCTRYRNRQGDPETLS